MTLKPIKGKRPSPRRMVFMGTNHVGKSSLAAEATGVFFMDAENGLDDIDCERTPVLESIDDVFEWFVFVHESKHRWLAIDSIDWIEKLIRRKVVEEKEGATSFGDPCFDFGRGKKLCMPYWDRFMNWLRFLQTDNNMGIIIVSHSGVVDVKKPDVETYQRVEPRIDPEPRDMICDWATEVLYLDFRPMVRNVDEGFKRERSIAVNGEMDRFIQTVPTAGVRAKNRLHLPDEIPFNSPAETWELIAQYAKAAKPKRKAAKPTEKPADIATEEVAEES